jgi:predicted transcriptional regulator
MVLNKSPSATHNARMTEKEIVLETIRELPDNFSIDEIADRIEFLAAVQKGLDQLDRGEGIPHEEIKKQFEQREIEIFRQYKSRLNRQAVALIKEQARQ